MLHLIINKLDELIYIQNQLLHIAEQKKIVLIERHVDELNQLVQEESKIIKHLNEVNQEREQLVETVLQHDPTMSFNQFVEEIQETPIKQKLQTQLSYLQSLMMELQDKNQVNERLLKDAMNFVQHMIEQVTKSKQQHFNYQSPLSQQKSPSNSQGFFDTKA